MQTTPNEAACGGEREDGCDAALLARTTMAALGRLLVGPNGDTKAIGFGDTLIAVGGRLSEAGLVWLADLAHCNGRHAIHLAMDPSQAQPDVTIAHREGKVVTVHERCRLAMPTASKPAMIVRPDLRGTAFALTGGKTLKRCRGPKRADDAAPSVLAASRRFHELREALRDTDLRPLRVKRR